MPQRPRPHGERATARRPRVGLIIAAIVAVGFGLLLMASFTGGQYALELATVAESPEAFDGKRVRVVGNIKFGSVRRVIQEGQPLIRFAIIDDHGNELDVSYAQSPPDSFEEGREAIAEGVLVNGGHTLDATRLTVKCPSKYQTEDGMVEQSPEYYRERYGPGADPTGLGGPSS